MEILKRDEGNKDEKKGRKDRKNRRNESIYLYMHTYVYLHF